MIISIKSNIGLDEAIIPIQLCCLKNCSGSFKLFQSIRLSSICLEKIILLNMDQKSNVLIGLIALTVLLAVPLMAVWPHMQTAEKFEQIQTHLSESLVQAEIQLGAGVKKVTGSSFNSDLQQALQTSINSAATYYSNNKSQQADYISHQLYKVMPVNWDVIMVTELNFSLGILDAVGIQTAAINGSLYAFWSGVCSYNKYYAYFVIGRNADLVGASVYLDTTRTNTELIAKEVDDVIRSINNVTKEHWIANYTTNVSNKLYQYNKKIWTVITTHYHLNNKYPVAYARLSGLGSVRASYEKQFKNEGTNYVNQIVYYYEDYQ